MFMFAFSLYVLAFETITRQKGKKLLCKMVTNIVSIVFLCIRDPKFLQQSSV